MNDIKIIKSHRKTIALHITETGELLVKAPVYCNNKTILDFVNSKRSWIEKKKQYIEEKLKHIEQNRLEPGGRIPFLGDFYEINVNPAIREKVIFDNLFLFKSEEIIRFALLKWYKQEAQNIIPGIAECEAAKFGLDISEIKVNSAKRRWGSCTSKKNINFSWRLVTLPEEVIHYVVIHELAHLIELNHSKKFWLLVEKLLPNYKMYERWLKKNSFKYAVDLQKG